MSGVDVPGALIAGLPLLLASLGVHLSLKLSQRRMRRAKAKKRHPANGCLSLGEQLEWARITAVLETEMTETEGRW